MLYCCWCVVNTDNWDKIFELSGLSTTLIKPVKWIISKSDSELKGIAVQGMYEWFHCILEDWANMMWCLIFHNVITMLDGNAVQNMYIFSASSGGTTWSFHSTLHADNNYYTSFITKKVAVIQGRI
jgi:hypothetical protein